MGRVGVDRPAEGDDGDVSMPRQGGVAALRNRMMAMGGNATGSGGAGSSSDGAGSGGVPVGRAGGGEGGGGGVGRYSLPGPGAGDDGFKSSSASAPRTSANSKQQYLQPSAEPLLYRVAGAKFCVVKRLPCLAEQVTERGVYLLWSPAGIIYVWHSADANALERVKALELAAAIKDRENAARASIERLESGDNASAMWQILGGQPSAHTNRYPPAAQEEAAFYSSLKLVQFSTAGRREVVERPPRRSFLESQSVVVIIAVEDPSGRAWLWSGKVGGG